MKSAIEMDKYNTIRPRDYICVHCSLRPPLTRFVRLTKSGVHADPERREVLSRRRETDGSDRIREG